MAQVPSLHASRWFPILLAALAAFSPALSGQTIRGRLLDAPSGQPIDLGVLVLFTTDGDSVGLTVTNPEGRFSITAPEPGSFLLRASAWGYRERQEGVFELGQGGRIDIEFRIAPRAVELEEILVSIDRPIAEHHLVRNGFVERYQRGLGHFITPRDLERSVYRDTESLFRMIPGVRVVPLRNAFALGDRVLMRGLMGGWCSPTVFIDGIRMQYDPANGATLSVLVPMDWLDAVEVYRRPTEVPLEYGITTSGGCGVILFWTVR